MKNQFLLIIFILIFGAMCWFGLPWWSLAVIAGIGAVVFKNTPLANFGLAFAAGVLLWNGFSIWQNVQNGGQFAAKIGQVFNGASPVMLNLITGLLGGLTAGMGALTGGLLRTIFEPTKKKRQYFKNP